MGRKLADRIYTKRGRYYADFRDFSDVGGSREALKPEGQRTATRDEDEALRLAMARLDDLKERRKGRQAAQQGDPMLRAYAKRHLKLKENTCRTSTVKGYERHLRRVVEYFGPTTRLSEIGVAGLANYVRWRRGHTGTRGTPIQYSTIRNELISLSGLYTRAVAEGVARDNPVQRMPDKPRRERPERDWLEVGEAAKVIRAAREMMESKRSRAGAYFHPLVATGLYTGMRKTELFGLLVGDVEIHDRRPPSEPHGLIHVRANRYRPLKFDRHARWVPLWPDLRAVLAPYVEGREADDLLFPSPRGGRLVSVADALTTCLEKAEIDSGRHITIHNFRHTYAATRMQTLDQGQPVSPYTVMRELGHSDLDMIERVYGHLQERRRRLPVVQYRETDVISIRAKDMEG